MIITANKGTTWDYITFQAGLNEFSMDSVMRENSYYYSDVVLFEGGEEIGVSDQPVIENSVIRAPWDSEVVADDSTIKTVWE